VQGFYEFFQFFRAADATGKQTGDGDTFDFLLRRNSEFHDPLHDLPGNRLNGIEVTLQLPECGTGAPADGGTGRQIQFRVGALGERNEERAELVGLVFESLCQGQPIGVSFDFIARFGRFSNADS
jgi:hypothetical protein